MSKAKLAGLAALALGLLFYLVGFKPLLPIVFLLVSVLYLPVPKLFDSWFSRLAVAFVVSICTLQVAGLAQFLLWPQSDFKFVAAICALAALALVLSRQQELPARILARHDWFGLAGAVLFLLPFTPILIGQDSVLRIAEIGGLQSPDAGHHFDFINAMAHNQRLDYSGYPKSFHLAVAFLQQAFIGSQAALSWQANALVFFGHYAIFGSLLAYITYFFAAALIKKITPRRRFRPILFNVMLSLALAVPLCFLIFWPFLEHGFLNYYFVAIAVCLGTIGLLYNRRSFAVVAFFGAAAAWPLIAPALIITVWLAITFKTMLQQKLFAATSTFLLLLPVAVQVLFPAATAELNALGALRTLHILILLAGLLLIGYAIFKLKVTKTVLPLYLPLFILVLGLAAMQLFVLGEVRYYPIKVALLLELLLVILGVAVLFAKFLQSNLPQNSLLILPFVPVVVLLLLLVPHDNPLKDTRDLFRQYSGQGKPFSYGQDALNFARLGREGKINYFNATVLHYNPNDQKITGHTLLAQWAQVIKYPVADPDRPGWVCHRSIYNNLVYGGATVTEQTALLEKIKECAQIARHLGQEYYIITDESSKSYLKSVLGEGVVYVSG